MKIKMILIIASGLVFLNSKGSDFSGRLKMPTLPSLSGVCSLAERTLSISDSTNTALEEELSPRNRPKKNEVQLTPEEHIEYWINRGDEVLLKEDLKKSCSFRSLPEEKKIFLGARIRLLKVLVLKDSDETQRKLKELEPMFKLYSSADILPRDPDKVERILNVLDEYVREGFLKRIARGKCSA